MTVTPQVLKIHRPDDWHLHLRDDDMLRTVLPFTSDVFARAIVMPNLAPPVTSIEAAVAYRERILAALPDEHHFTPLMTCYLTDTVNAEELVRGFQQGVFTAAKLYPANATTNSAHGVSDVRKLYPVLEQMQKIGMPLLVHGEVTHPDIDIFDREAHFIDEVLNPLRQQLPELKIVFEHITTREAAQYVLDSDSHLAATVTPQHLMFNRNHMLVGGIRPHLFCLPILKRNVHQQALRQAVASGSDRFFLGTDSAPHLQHRKESNCGCAGCFNAPLALSAYATVFDEMDALPHFEAFCSLNGAKFYGLPVNADYVELTKTPVQQIQTLTVGNESLIPFLAGQTLAWKVTAC